MAEGRGHTIQIVIAVIGLVAAIGGATLSNWQNTFSAPEAPERHSAAANPTPVPQPVGPT